MLFYATVLFSGCKDTLKGFITQHLHSKRQKKSYGILIQRLIYHNIFNHNIVKQFLLKVVKFKNI